MVDHGQSDHTTDRLNLAPLTELLAGKTMFVRLRLRSRADSAYVNLAFSSWCHGNDPVSMGKYGYERLS